MKIAMIGQKGIPAGSGGIERHVEELSAELAKHGHEVLVSGRSWYTKEKGTYRGVRSVLIPTFHTKYTDTFIHTLFSIFHATKEKVDIFHFHGVGPSLLCWLPKLLRPSAKVIATFHCIDRHHQKWGALARWFLHLGEYAACKFPDATISVSQSLKNYCRLDYAKTTIYIPNGTQIPTETPSKKLLEKFDLTSGNYVLFCARLVKHKGAHLLIEAWKKLIEKHPELVQDKKLAIVGGPTFTDNYVRQLQTMIHDTPSIVMTGTQVGENLYALYGHCLAMVHPSESEGMPITILEAMSYGKCVLASDIPENMELVQEYGLTFQNGNVDHLVEKMAEMLENQDKIQVIGRDARAFVARQFDWKDIGEVTSCLYEVLKMEPKLKEAKI